ncbi:MAG: voltage-gated potassium channel [Cryomorphaceae bacterium]|jgi:voltage-gated potassium channel
MSDIFFLVLRRLRLPLIVLIFVYAAATLGMTLIPGVDDQGNVYRMSFFHAFYFVSFTGTTIGFGEIPYAFTDSQRAWVIVCLYTSVVAWLYGIGNMLRLLQDETFLKAVAHRAFQGSIARIDLPFYIICGYGQTGELINHGLAELAIQTVIVDHNLERTRSLELDDLTIAPIVLNADITQPQNLVAAGISHPLCQGVIAVTQDDHINLQIAVASKLIDKSVPVICRSEIEDEAANMASFGTDSIINPYLTFSQRLSLLAHNPALHRIQNWFINQHSAEHLAEHIAQHGLPGGRWILCGYGRFGQAVKQNVKREDLEIVVVDIDPESHGAPADSIVGRGTEAKTLQEAGIDKATVIVAASDDDANNLSILITARQLNKDIFTIGRVNREANHSLFIHADCDYIMRRSQVVANEVLTIISRPLVTKFVSFSKTLTSGNIQKLINDIDELTGGRDPITWRLVIDEENAPAFARYLRNDRSLTVNDVSQHQMLPSARTIPLLLQRGDVSHLMPALDTELKIGDELLLCGKRGQHSLAQRLRHNPELVDSLINNNPHHIPLMRWLSRRRVAQSKRHY